MQPVCPKKAQNLLKKAIFTLIINVCRGQMARVA